MKPTQSRKPALLRVVALLCFFLCCFCFFASQCNCSETAIVFTPHETDQVEELSLDDIEFNTIDIVTRTAMRTREDSKTSKEERLQEEEKEAGELFSATKDMMENGLSSVRSTVEHGVPIFASDWYQRSMTVLTNAVRMSPASFARSYLTHAKDSEIVLGESVSPVWRNQFLESAAELHADDMAGQLNTKAGCNSHSSCDGSKTMEERVQYMYKGAYGNITENLSTGTEDVTSVIVDWLRSEESRNNLMDSTVTVTGVGYNAKKAERFDALNHQWTQNLVAGSNPDEKYAIIAGSHFIFSHKIRFMANYFDVNSVNKYSALKSAELVLNGKSISLANEYPFNDDASSNFGTFSVDLPLDTKCRTYYFKFVNSNNQNIRYPETGAFYTQKEGDCKQSYTTLKKSGRPSVIITLAVLLLFVLIAVVMAAVISTVLLVKRHRENKWKKEYHQRLSDFLDEYQY